MEHKLRVSVAIATYNGEKYIEEQLLSICRQTRKPDEIVISDDGSKDATLGVVNRIASSHEGKEIDFVVITDNPRHGCGGNFDWAISHTKGDIIFVCGQDDLWMPEKIAQIIQIFEDHDDACCVLHNAKIIDSCGYFSKHSFLTGVNDELFTRNRPEGEIFKLDQALLEQSVSSFLVPGIAIAVRKELAQQLSPIPTLAEDQWIEFMALLNDGCYFYNQVLVYYRKHQNNTSGSRANLYGKIRRLFREIKSIGNREKLYLYEYELGSGCLRCLTEKGMENTMAFGTAKRLLEIGTSKAEAYRKGGLIGSLKLINLYINDMRYRRIGFWAFFYDIMFVLLKK